MHKSKLIFTIIKDIFRERFSSLSRRKKTLFISLIAVTVMFSIPSSVVFGENICKHFSYIGAREKAPAVYYALYTIYALLYNVANHNAFKLTESEKQKWQGSQSTAVFAKLIIVYAHNFALSLYFAVIPMIVYFLTYSSNATSVLMFFFLIPILPFIPMAISTPTAIFLPPKESSSLAKSLALVLFVIFSAFVVLAGGEVMAPIVDNAYIISTFITKYYFPAHFFETTIIDGNGFILFVLSNVSAMYISVVALTKDKRL